MAGVLSKAESEIHADAIALANKIKGVYERKKHGKITVDVAFKVFDKNGKVVSETKKTNDAAVANFLQMLYGIMAGAANNKSGTVVNEGGFQFLAPYITSATDDIMFVNAGASDSNKGIQVGTGSAAPTPADYKLGTLITTGNGAGQLAYAADVLTPPSTSGQTTSFVISRNFTNNSGAPITVTEIGLAALCYVWDNTNNVETGEIILLARDVLGTAQTINDGQSSQGTYTISVST